jgi:hypothetical protein
MISVFKTSVKHKKDTILIKKLFENLRIDFDLEDCDKILRVEGNSYTANEIIQKIGLLGFRCEELE